MPNPVHYAEDYLGVHEVWEEAEHRLLDHRRLTEDIKELNRRIRGAKENLADRESVLVADHGADLVGLSKTAAKEHMKAVIDADAEAQRIRDQIATAEAERQEADLDLRHQEVGLKVLTARMQELDGLLEFYAASKRNTTSP